MSKADYTRNLLRGKGGVMLREMRREAGMSQEDVSRASGVPLRTVQHWEERGVWNARAGSLKKVADAVGATVDELLASGCLDDSPKA